MAGVVPAEIRSPVQSNHKCFGFGGKPALMIKKKKKKKGFAVSILTTQQ